LASPSIASIILETSLALGKSASICIVWLATTAYLIASCFAKEAA